MNVQEIACELIDVPPLDRKLRSSSKELVKKIAQSIELEGLFNPIVVRPNPEKPGRFILVQDRHRLYAVQKVNKEQFIRATIMTDMDDEDHRMATLSENLWRADISKKQRMLYIQQWWEYYRKKYDPEPKKAADTIEQEPACEQALQQTTSGQKAHVGTMHRSGSNNGVAQTAEVRSNNNGILANAEPATETSESKADTNTANGFSKWLAALAEVSGRTARRCARIVSCFTREELEAFYHCGVTEQMMSAIAGVKDDAKRKAVTALVVAGVEFHQAWKDTFGEDIDLSASTNAEKKEKAKAKEVAVPDLTDDEWFNHECGEKASNFRNPTKFKAAALLYRHTAEARAKFRAATKKILADAKKARENNNSLWWAINKVVSLSHPKDWWFCRGCTGKRHTEHGEECGRCRGSGFELRTEEYL